MTIELAMHNEIAVITMADEAKRNALSRGLVREMLRAIEESRGARALVIEARGKVFCAGADISDMAGEGGVMDDKPATDGPLALFQALIREPRLVIAAVHAGAFGGGFELTLCCDMVVAAPEAFFMLPETAHGALPPIAMARLPGIIGTRRALELMATRRRLPAVEAHAMGVVNRLAQAGEATQAAIALAHEAVDAAPPAALAAVKQGIARYSEDLDEASRRAVAQLDEAEWREGFAAFGEKRKPDYARLWRKRAGG